MLPSITRFAIVFGKASLAKGKKADCLWMRHPRSGFAFSSFLSTI